MHFERFEFATAGRIVFGRGAIRELPKQARAFGTRALVVTGRNTRRAAPVVAALEERKIVCSLFSVAGEPTLDTVRRGTLAAREGCELVIGFGGGSAIDAAKAIAALATNSGEPLDYLEVIGRGRPLEHAPLPFIAVPTTAGTGAEVTRNAVIGSPEQGAKASLRSTSMLAKVAVIDPELTIDVPPEVTASTGLDTFTQLIEPYVSSRANPMTDLFCIEGMKRVAASLEWAYRDGKDLEARESMSFASLLSGLALANAGLGVVHGFAGPLGGMIDAPHGALCAALLPYGVAANLRALRERDPESETLRRYTEISRILTSRADAQPEEADGALEALCRKLAIPRLRDHGFTRTQIPELVEKAERASSMKANPIVLTRDELTRAVEEAL